MQLGAATILVAMLLASAAAGQSSAPIVPEAVLDGDPEIAPPPEAALAANGNADPALLALQPATTRLYRAMTGGASDEEIERLVAAVAIELDMDCPRVKEFQVYRATARARTMKVKCTERPLYAVTVGVSGEAFVSGGDGTIGQMRLADGPIKAMRGVRVEEYIADTRRDAPQPVTAAPAATVDDHPGRTWLVRIASVAGIALIAWLAYLALRERRRQRRTLSRWRGLDSDSKSVLIEESEEIYPNLYRHPAGVFLARGRRGKRRLFSSLMFAYLYSSRGIKLFEIR